MKKIIILMVLSVLTLPAIAACSITGAACSASMLRSTPLNEKYVPDNIKNIQKPDAFTPKYVTPYENLLINTETAPQTPSNETPGYIPTANSESAFPAQIRVTEQSLINLLYKPFYNREAPR